ncbi:acyltransferase-domain-containing protein [Chlamydoabsidia padenii]|nr:acyltransferase-domain-containing protein [Chlamydoabsidia padenii]
MILSLPVYHYGSRPLYLGYINYILQIWSESLVAVFQLFSPSTLIFTLDDTCFHDNSSSSSPAFTFDDLVKRNKDGQVTQLVFPERVIVTLNHQASLTYADWAYAWCVAYLNKGHGAVKIILKSSLKKLPVYGPAMDFAEFIFVKRKLASDKTIIVDNLKRSQKDKRPLWLLVYPEGTIISENTRKKSKDYAEKNDLKDTRYTLLPRSSGLHLCIESLGDSVEWLYDLTIGYCGVKIGDYPENVYTMGNIFFYNKQPKEIHVHVRRFLVKDIPVQDKAAFDQWMYQRWVEKDDLMAHFYKEGRFPGTKNTFDFPLCLPDLSRLILPSLLLLPYVPLLLVTWYFANWFYSYL